MGEGAREAQVGKMAEGICELSCEHAEVRGNGMSRAKRFRSATIALLVCACFAGCSPPFSASLDDLVERHPATGPEPADFERGRWLYLISPRHWGAAEFADAENGARFRQALTDKGVFLEFRTLWFRKAVWIPVSAITGCSRSQAPYGLRRWNTNLWVEDSQVLMRFPDEKGHIAKWCTDRGLTVAGEAMEGTWLQDPHRSGRLP